MTVVLLPFFPAPVSIPSVNPVPTIVRDLESDFLSRVRAGLDATPYLSNGGRSEIKGLLDQGAAPRAVGERLLRAYVEEKVRKAIVRFGPDEVRMSRHPASRYFEPMQERQRARPNPPKLPGDLLEVSLGLEALRNGGFGVIDEMTAFLAGAVESAGWFVHSCLPPGAAHESPDILRIGSIDALEAGLHHFFGPGAARFCFVRGVIPPGDMNALHREGWHGIGLPMEAVEAHDQIYGPVDLALHDAWHGAYWSATVSSWTRRAAVSLYDVLEERLSARDKKKVQGVIDLQLVDLLLEVEGLPGVINKLRKELPRHVFLGAMLRWPVAAIPVTPRSLWAFEGGEDASV